MANQERAGVLVRYNPCSIYAREGSPCPYFRNSIKHCSKLPKLCEMPEYDKWFKDALAGKIHNFYNPRRIYLLEVSGVPLFIYHSHEKKIVGEVAINKVTKENRLFHYWFDEFLSYPNYVDLTKIRTDKGLGKLTSKGRWVIKYLDDRTIEEIRNFSQIPTDIKEKLANELQNVKQKIAKIPKPKHPLYPQDKLVFARYKLKEIELKHHVDDTILNEAYKVFAKAAEKGKLRGRSTLDFVYASLYTAYRLLKIPITLNEFSKQHRVNPKKLSRDYRTLLIRFGLTVPMLSPKDFVMKYSQHLPISQETRKLAVSITETIEKSLIRGKSPCTVAATVVYIACKKRNETVTQEQIAEAFGITAASIRNCMKLLCKSPKDC